MADIKERKRETGSIKEKHTSVPKELIKQEAIHSIQWARQQVQEAAGPEQQENEGAETGMTRLSVPQIKRHSRSKLKRETHDTPTTASKSTAESDIMSTDTAVESEPTRIQESYTHAQEQGRKLAIHQEREKAARIKERAENVTPSDFVLEPHTRIDPPLLRPILFVNAPMRLLPSLLRSCAPASTNTMKRRRNPSNLRINTSTPASKISPVPSSRPGSE